jgi:hypothetical protein
MGDDDELGAANLITPAKRKQALALARRTDVSLAHDIVQEKADAANILERTIVTVSPTAPPIDTNIRAPTMGDSQPSRCVDCHIMFEGKGYNGGRGRHHGHGGCPKGNINAVKMVSSHEASCSTRHVCRARPVRRVAGAWNRHPPEDLERWKKSSMSKLRPAMSSFSTRPLKRRATLGPGERERVRWLSF